jgi:hypothetical protein
LALAWLGSFRNVHEFSCVVSAGRNSAALNRRVELVRNPGFQDVALPMAESLYLLDPRKSRLA